MLDRIMGSSRRVRRLRLASMAAFGIGFLYLIYASAIDPLAGLQNAFTDTLFRDQQGSPNIVIVGIDEDALEQYGRLNTWPRERHATAIANLQSAGAGVIAYDIVFGDASDEDALLAEAIADAGIVILPGVGLSLSPGADSASYVYSDIALPVQELQDAAAGVAHSNIETSGDGRVRRIPLFASDTDGQRYPSLVLAAFNLQFGAEPGAIGEVSGGSMTLIGREVPLEDHGTMRINYVGGQDSFTFIPFAQVLAGDFDPAQVERKIVLVGLAAGAADRHSAPLLNNAAGVEIHANGLDTLLRARFLTPAKGWLAMLTGVVFIAIAAYTIPHRRIGIGASLTIVLAAGYVVVAAFTFYQGYILDAVTPPSALLLAAVVGLVSRVLAERATQDEVEVLFGRYVSGDVAKELIDRADRGTLQLGGEVREVTVVFGDIRGFTTISEGMNPAELVELVNRYFDVAVTSISEHGGMVNKYFGDAIMAVWNAPRIQPDHALLACRAAAQASAALEALEGDDGTVRFGFGITTGEALAGNVGASGRLEYTVMGETVNTSSRLSGAAPGGEIWISERTQELVRAQFATELLPPQQLKGMTQAVTAYRLKDRIESKNVELT